MIFKLNDIKALCEKYGLTFKKEGSGSIWYAYLPDEIMGNYQDDLFSYRNNSSVINIWKGMTIITNENAMDIKYNGDSGGPVFDMEELETVIIQIMTIAKCFMKTKKEIQYQLKLAKINGMF